MCMCMHVHRHICVFERGVERLNTWKGEFVLSLDHVDLALKNSLSVTGTGKSYEHPTISKLLSHRSHL